VRTSINMLKIKSFFFALSLTPLLLTAWQLPNQAQTGNSPSLGTAGGASGGGTTGSSGTVLSVPTTVTGAGLGSATGNLEINFTPEGTPILTVPPVLQTAVSSTARSVSVTFSTGSLSQQQVAQVVSALPAIATSLGASISTPVTVGGQSFTNLGSALTAVQNQVSGPGNGLVTVRIGTTSIRISPAQ
jgi:hypothetical protein